MNVLICGDSFSANWHGKYPGWPCLLSNDFNVTNRSQAGVGEYKILKQVEQGVDFDFIIVSHTSPSRVHTRNSLHKTDLHKNCDLLYNDVAGKWSVFNKKVKSAKLWFETHYDDDYQWDIYKLFREKIDNLLQDKSYLSISHLPVLRDYSIEKKHLHFDKFWTENRGTVNHYTESGNRTVYETIKDLIV